MCRHDDEDRGDGVGIKGDRLCHLTSSSLISSHSFHSFQASDLICFTSKYNLQAVKYHLSSSLSLYMSLTLFLTTKWESGDMFRIFWSARLPWGTLRPSMDCCNCWKVMYIHIYTTHFSGAHSPTHIQMQTPTIWMGNMQRIDVGFVETNFNVYIKKLCLSISSSDTSVNMVIHTSWVHVYIHYSRKCHLLEYINRIL